MRPVEKHCQDIARWTRAEASDNSLGRVCRDFHGSSSLIPDRAEDIPERGVVSDDR